MSKDRSAPAGGSVSAATLFEVLWGALTDLLGTAATTALLRRSIKRCRDSGVALTGLEVRRNGLEYVYQLPAEWSASNQQPLEDLCALVTQLRPLLVELTGGVVLRRLQRVPELARTPPLRRLLEDGT